MRSAGAVDGVSDGVEDRRPQRTHGEAGARPDALTRGYRHGADLVGAVESHPHQGPGTPELDGGAHGVTPDLLDRKSVV